jgi:flagellum-specific peptidoglycan hydrolase FlgJ
MDDYFMNYAPLTRETLQQALFYAGLTSPEIVFAQARLETGNFTSVLCVHYNNLFGMKMPRVRNTTAAGSTDNGYAVYESWYHSVLDMREFQEYYRAAGRCLQDYFSFLQGIGYAEDSYYIQKLAQLCSI